MMYLTFLLSLVWELENDHVPTFCTLWHCMDVLAKLFGDSAVVFLVLTCCLTTDYN